MRLGRIQCLLLIAVLILATACSAGPSGGASGPTPTPIPPEPGVEQPTYTVRRGTVTRELEFTARVAPVQQADLFFRADGYLNRLPVKQDETVQKGQVLAELEMADLQRQLETAKLDWQQAQIENSHTLSRTLLALQETELSLARARAANPDPTVLQKQVELTRSQEALAYAEEEYRKALDRIWEPQEVRDAYAHQVTEAQRDLEVAQATYEDAVRERAYNLQQLELAVSIAQLEHESALYGPDPRLKQKVEQLEAQVAERRIVAPFDGVVLSLAAAPGERVEAYRTTLVVGDPSELELRADLSAEQMSDLAVGQEATLAPADYPGQIFQGQVRQLPYGWGEEAEETDRSVHITLGPDAPDLELGALVRAAIILEEKDGVLWLPSAVLQIFQGRTFVIVEEPSGAQRRVDVTIGIESEERVEIVSGLEEGEVVVGQ